MALQVIQGMQKAHNSRSHISGMTGGVRERSASISSVGVKRESDEKGEGGGARARAAKRFKQEGIIDLTE